ncbi:MAG: class I SAM-dependent methyltransferase [Thermoleophilia bacterium]|nr:class I SAM-dependent methyltransferase [Thermoleophilia bacterium]
MKADLKKEQKSGKDAGQPVNCAVCGSAGATLKWTVRDTLLDFQGEQQIVQCRLCGTLRMSPLPPFEERRRAFSDEYPLFDWALGRKHASPGQRIARFAAQIDQINRRQRPGRLLDVGAGDGYFMLCMKQRGWEVSGIELNEQVAIFAREQLGLDMAAGAEHEVDWDGSYDCITLFGVIEDVDDPAALLGRCHRHLNEGGLLVVQTHNIASWEARYFGRHWFNVEAPRHVWHFSPGTLGRLLEQNRFGLEDLLHYGSAFVTERSIENRRGRKFPASALDRLLRKVAIAPAEKILPRLGQGIMIEAYCRKAGRAAGAPGPQVDSPGRVAPKKAVK